MGTPFGDLERERLLLGDASSLLLMGGASEEDDEDDALDTESTDEPDVESTSSESLRTSSISFSRALILTWRSRRIFSLEGEGFLAFEGDFFFSGVLFPCAPLDECSSFLSSFLLDGSSTVRSPLRAELGVDLPMTILCRRRKPSSADTEVFLE